MRTVPEWVGATDDTPIPRKVKDRILRRYGFCCYRTGHAFRPGDPVEFDHIRALANGGENRESNLAPILGGKPHKDKTAADRDEQAHVERLRAKHLGFFPKPIRRLQGRGFRKGRE